MPYHQPRLRIIAALAALLSLSTLLAACRSDSPSAAPASSGSSPANLSSVTVAGEKNNPTLTMPVPFSVTDPVKKELLTGTGEPAAVGKRITIDYVGYNGTDGKPFDSSYGAKPRTFLLSAQGNLKGLVDGLVGEKAGSRILLALPPKAAYGLQGRPAAGIGPTDTIVLLVDVRAVKGVLTRATGEPVPPKKGLPTVTLAKDGAPTIKLPDSAPPTELVVQPLIVGAGPKVTKGAQVTVNYKGVIWPGGKEFDSSWGKTPATFEIGTGRVIAGWDKALVGRTVGSQLLLVIPPDDGYGAEGRPESGIKGTDTLVFVVDILDVA